PSFEHKGSGTLRPESAMRILTTKRVVALLVIFAMLAIDSCSLSLSAGSKRNSVTRRQGNEVQARANQAGQEKPESTISIETALVNLDVLVMDQEGRVLSGLKRENFRVLDNGKPQVITHFEPTSAPITIAMLME